uniref:BTB domain-containing protein n=1 Tax=Panagrellus redivivus TaxID=6233 RepID=A0A7E4UYB2_PANRE
MSTSDKSGVAQLAKEIGGLYLSNDFSDVTIVIDGTELPAHRMILSQRCPYFKTMFASRMIESTSKRIELRETPINGFKSVLQWIYAGEIEFRQVDTALEVHRLSNMYELLELEKLAFRYIEDNCDMDNICLILNSATILSISWSLIYDFMESYGSDILACEAFLSLSKDAVNAVLRKMGDVTNIEMLEAFVRWMKANPDQSEHFLDLLKQIPLNSINFGELLSIVPAELISANVLADVAREQQIMNENGSVISVNVAAPKYGAKVIAGSKTAFFSERFFDESVYDAEEVVIDLGQRFKLNSLFAERVIVYSETGRIAIYVSEDDINWTCVVNHKRLDKRYNDYDFGEHVVRFIRICGTVPLNDLIELHLFTASYVDMETVR